MYLKSGRFSVEHMISVLCDNLAAIEGSFPALRAAGEMSWVLPQPPGADDFFAYESALNRIATEEPAVFMCLYDLRRCAVSMLVDVLKTHPTVLVDRMVLYNPHYVSPQEYVAEAERPSGGRVPAGSRRPAYPTAVPTAPTCGSPSRRPS